MLFGLSSDIPNVIIHAKFHIDRLRGFWAAGPPKVPFPILIGTTLTTVLHYRADCDVNIMRLTRVTRRRRWTKFIYLDYADATHVYEYTILQQRLVYITQLTV